jgi:predicted lipoprotein with Yx(FWY)xxD motif
MQQMDQHHRSTRPRSAGRLAAAALAVGALCAAMAMMAPGIAGAQGSTTATTISTAKDAKLGTILMAGDTPVYTVKSKKACDATCMTARPPVLLPQGVTTPTAGSGVDASKLGTTTADGGSLQVTYAGKPLYWSAKDTGSGKPRGIGSDKFGKWALVVTKAGSSNSGGGGSNPGSGGVSF